MGKPKAISTSHPLCKPPKNAQPIESPFHGSTKLWMLDTDNRWKSYVPGKPAFAFVGALDGDHSTAIIWIANCRCPIYTGCPIGRATDFVLDKLDIGVSSIQRRVRARR